MKQVQACFTTREDRESSFHHCGSPVRLVQARLCAGKTRQSRFILRGGDVKQVQSCLSASLFAGCSGGQGPEMEGTSVACAQKVFGYPLQAS